MTKRAREHKRIVDYEKTMKIIKKELQRYKSSADKCGKNDIVDTRKCATCSWVNLGVCMKLHEYNREMFGFVDSAR